MLNLCLTVYKVLVIFALAIFLSLIGCIFFSQGVPDRVWEPVTQYAPGRNLLSKRSLMCGSKRGGGGGGGSEKSLKYRVS